MVTRARVLSCGLAVLLALAGAGWATAGTGDIIYLDPFESGSLAGWSSTATNGGDLAVSAAAALNGTTMGLQAVVNDTTPLFVRDDRPTDESRYRVRFFLDPNGFDPGEASNHLRVRVLIVSDTLDQRLVAIVLRRRSGVYSIEARVRQAGGVRADTGFFTITDAPHTIEFDWTRASAPAATDGTFELWVDGVSKSALAGLANGGTGVEYARLGAMSVKTGAGGTLFFDEFESHHPPACLDQDHDGWTACDGDCCDAPGSCGGVDPALVNPGAFEVVGNGVDDDCDGQTDNVTVCDNGTLASNSADPLDYARAMDLCSFTFEAPSLAARRWGVLGGGFSLADGTGSPAALSRSIRPNFGSGAVPQSGTRLAVLSTGSAAAPGQVNPPYIAPEGGQSNGTSSNPPPDWVAAHGGSVPPSAPNCPFPIGNAVDPILLKLRLRVPTNARSFSVRAALLSSEFPEWVCSQYDDYFVTLIDSFLPPPATPNPADKNLAIFDPGTPPGTVYLVGSGLAYVDAALFHECQNGPVACSSPGSGTNIHVCTDITQLTGTGFDLGSSGCEGGDLVGGGTGWATISGNVTPGETIELRFAVWDSGDGLYDTDVLLDSFQWSTAEAVPGTTP